MPRAPQTGDSQRPCRDRSLDLSAGANGAYRVPAMARWPGLVRPGTVINDLLAHEDGLTTLMAAVGESQTADKLKEGEAVGGATYKVHLDDYDQRDLLAKGNGKREEFIYWTDDGNVAGSEPLEDGVHGAARPWFRRLA